MPEEKALIIPENRLTIEQSSKVTRLAAFTPANLGEAIALSKLIASSELAPKEYRGKPGNVLIGMQYAAELGIAPFTGIQNISIINGRASVWGDLALALVQGHPAYESHKEYFEGQPFNDNYAAVFEIKRRGQDWYKFTFSVADAKTAKLWGKRGYNGQDTPWITNPKRMLQMRARGFGLRDKFADALKGLILAEEAMDVLVDPTSKAREAASADLSSLAPAAAIVPSSEPNRGHGNEGMTVQNRTPEPAMDQSPKKQPADEMCAECRAVNGHLPSCKYHAQWKAGLGQQTSAAPETQTAATAETAASDEPVKRLVRISKVENKKSTNGNPYYRIIAECDPEGEARFICWHLNRGKEIAGKVGALGVLLVHPKKDKAGVFFEVDDIVELDNVPYKDGNPVEQAGLDQEEGW